MWFLLFGFFRLFNLAMGVRVCLYFCDFPSGTIDIMDFWWLKLGRFLLRYRFVAEIQWWNWSPFLIIWNLYRIFQFLFRSYFQPFKFSISIIRLFNVSILMSSSWLGILDFNVLIWVLITFLYVWFFFQRWDVNFYLIFPIVWLLLSQMGIESTNHNNVNIMIHLLKMKDDPSLAAKLSKSASTRDLMLSSENNGSMLKVVWVWANSFGIPNSSISFLTFRFRNLDFVFCLLSFSTLCFWLLIFDYSFSTCRFQLLDFGLLILVLTPKFHSFFFKSFLFKSLIIFPFLGYYSCCTLKDC